MDKSKSINQSILFQTTIGP